MSRAILRWIPQGNRWEALPSRDDGSVASVLDVRVLDDSVRLLLGVTGPVGFVIDVDHDLGSHLDLLARWIDVDQWRDEFDDPDRAIDGVEIEVTATERAMVAVRSSSAVSSVTVPAVRPARGPSRRVSVEPVGQGVRVVITARWWFALWGMWFSVVRGDGLVLADLPVRRRLDVEVVPNAVPVRPGDLRGVLRRGPTTRRRIATVVLVALALVTTLVATLVSRTDEDAEMLEVEVASVETVTEVTLPTPTVAPTTAAVAPSNSPPAGPSPDSARRPATSFVTADGVIGADARVTDPLGQLTPGGALAVEISLDWSAVNLFGGVDGRGDPVESMRSCRGVLEVFRTTPTIPGPTQTFRVLLAPLDGGEQILVSETSQSLQLVGAMAEECPEADPSSTDPYRIRQRTFYEPFVVSGALPESIATGEYEVVVEIVGVMWNVVEGPAVDVG